MVVSDLLAFSPQGCERARAREERDGPTRQAERKRERNTRPVCMYACNARHTFLAAIRYTRRRDSYRTYSFLAPRTTTIVLPVQEGTALSSACYVLCSSPFSSEFALHLRTVGGHPRAI